MSEDMIFRTTSLFHPTEASEYISVILLDDKSSRELNKPFGYPIPFDKHAGVLTHAMCSGPSSLFIDFNFRYLRLSQASRAQQDYSKSPPYELQDLISALDRKPSANSEFCPILNNGVVRSITDPEVFLARVQTADDKECDPFFNKEFGEQCVSARALAPLKKVVTPVSVSPLGEDGSYTLATPYPQSDGKQVTKLEASPALAMVIDFCKKSSKEITRTLAGCRDLKELKALLNTSAQDNKLSLVPLWPFYRTRTTELDEKRIIKASKVSACPVAQNYSNSESLTAKLLLLWKNFLNVIVHSGASKDTPFGNNLCIPFDHFSAIDLRNLATHDDIEGNVADLRKAAFLSGRMIFYGAKITAINDTYKSPVLGNVPGVVIHATVADNLLNYGINYINRPIKFNLIFGWGIDIAQIVEISLLVIFFIIFRFYNLFGDWKQRIFYRALFVTSVTFITAWGAFSYLSFPPANMLGILLLTSLILSFGEDEKPNNRL